MREQSFRCNGVSKAPRAFRLLLSIVVVYPLTLSNAWADLDLSFPWVKGYDLSRPPVRGSLPGLNQPFIDSVHGTSITRITESDAGWRRHEYSRRPAFNADSSRILMKSSSGNWLLYRVDGDRIVFDKVLPGQMSELNWHPTDPNVYRYFPYNGAGMKILQYNVVTGATSTVADFNGRLPWATASRVWTRWEGRPSADGRIWCLMAENQNFNAVGLFSYDLSSDQILGSISLTDSQDPDHVSTSVTGQYCVPSSTDSMGTRAYSLDFSQFKQLHTTSEHSDTALDKDGRDVLVLADYSNSWIRMADMATGQSTPLVPLYQPSGSAFSVHISGLATDTPGYAVLSTYGANLDYGNTRADYGDMWGHDRLAVVELKSSPEVYNVAYMRNGDAGYFSEPQATVNRDLSKIIFASTWGTGNESDVRSYMVTMPEGRTEPTTATVSISAAQVDENSATAIAKVSLNRPLRSVATVAVATTPETAINGSDFYGLYRVLNFAPGVTSIDVPVVIIDDAVGEVDETFAIRVFNLSDNLEFGTRTAQFVISDND